MTPITLICILIYLMGCVFSFMLLNSFNQYIDNENEKTQIGEILIWSLLSWVFLLIIVIISTITQIVESRIFKKLKSYFERKLKQDIE